MDVSVVSAVAAALADPRRLTVYRLSDGTLSVGEIAIHVGVSSSAVSYHAKILERAGLLTIERRGRRHAPVRSREGLRAFVNALA